MQNYYTDLVLKIDLALLTLSALLSVSIVIYVMLMQTLERIRRLKLMSLISRLQDAALEKKQPAYDKLTMIMKKATTFEFLDIARHRNDIFPNEFSEKFMSCVSVSGRVDKAEKAAGSSWNKWRRIEAMITIGYLKTPHAVKILAKAIRNKDADISYFSALALGYVKNAEAAKALFDAVRSHLISGYRIAAILEGFPAEIIEDELARHLKSRDETSLFWAIKLAVKFKFKKYASMIKHLESDKSPVIKAAAIEGAKELS